MNYYIQSLFPALMARKKNPLTPTKEKKEKELKRERRETVREKAISSFSILFLATGTICVFCTMSASLWEFHKLMMITAYFS